MPQGPLGSYSARKVGSTALAPMFLDANGKSLVTTNGGTLSSLNNTAAALIQAGALRLCRIIIVAPGSGSGAFTINDSATLAGAAAANEVWSLPYNATSNVAGASFSLDWPMANGLVLSAVPGAGSPVIALSYTF